MRRLILAIVLAVTAGAGWWWARTRIPPPAEWQGYAEVDFVKIGPTQQGLLTSVFVTRGTTVAAGAPLFEQDDTAGRAAVDQAARQLAQTEAQLAKLQAGGKRPRLNRRKQTWQRPRRRSPGPRPISNEANHSCAFVQFPSRMSINFGPITARRKPRFAGSKRPSRRCGRRLAGIPRLPRNAQRSMRRARRWPWQSGGSTSAALPRQWLAPSTTSLPAPARASRRARRSCRCFRPKISSSGSSSPSRCWPRPILATNSRSFAIAARLSSPRRSPSSRPKPNTPRRSSTPSRAARSLSTRSRRGLPCNNPPCSTLASRSRCGRSRRVARRDRLHLRRP